MNPQEMDHHKPRGRTKERAMMLALWSMVWVSTEAAPTGGQPSRLSGTTGVPPVDSITDTRDAPVCQVIPFNLDFRFGLGSRKDAEQPSYDDSAWESIGLPHSFSIPYFRASRFFVGEGWYRKRFTVPAAWAGKHVRLEFEGSFQHTAVFLNGLPAGRHDGGYSGFDIDLTPLLKPGKNLLAVRVDNRWDPVLPPRAGEHVFCGGIYRDLRLVVADPLHIPRNGICVTTPEVSAARALVKVAVTLTNTGKTPRTCTVRTTVVAPDGKTPAAQASNHPPLRRRADADGGQRRTGARQPAALASRSSAPLFCEGGARR